MKALTFHGLQNIHCEWSPDPAILDPQDVLVKVQIAGICGSDLHVYHGRETGLDTGTVMGHELAGEVVAAGKAVRRFQLGDRVFSPFTPSCGQCFYCKMGLTCRCEKGNLYGWVQQGCGLHGGQAEYVRVPLADGTLMHLSQDLSLEQGLLLGDILPTGYFCADQAGIQPGNTYVVVGCGPVGLMAVIGALDLGATRLFAVDSVPERLAQAAAFGAIPLSLPADGVKAAVWEATEGRGADAVMEAVGSPGASRLAMDLVRPGGTISTVGVHTSPQFAFSPVEAYDKNLTFKIGRCPAKTYAERILRKGTLERYDPTAIITHRLSLEEGPAGYRMFDKKEENCLKAVLLPFGRS